MYSRGAYAPSKRSLRRLAHVDLGDAEALPVGEYRQEAVLVPVERDLFQHAALHGAGVAPQVAEAQARHAAHDAVEGAAPQALEEPSCARRAVADRQIGRGRARHELRDLAALDLMVGRQR